LGVPDADDAREAEGRDQVGCSAAGLASAHHKWGCTHRSFESFQVFPLRLTASGRVHKRSNDSSMSPADSKPETQLGCARRRDLPSDDRSDEYPARSSVNGTPIRSASIARNGSTAPQDLLR